MESDSIVVLETYYEAVAAHLARTRLEAVGIPCFLSNENLLTLNLLYSPAAGGVRLHVYARDAERATEALRPTPQMQAIPGGLAPAATATNGCPRCGSPEVAAVAGKADTSTWWQALLAQLRRYPLQGRESHCFHCGLDF